MPKKREKKRAAMWERATKSRHQIYYQNNTRCFIFINERPLCWSDGPRVVYLFMYWNEQEWMAIY